MRCGLLDIACHVQSAAWEWWASVSLLNKGLIVLGLVGLIVALSWSFLAILKRLGGWPAVGAAIAVILGVVLAILPKKPKEPDWEDGEPKRFRVPPALGSKRRFNTKTNRWE